MKLYIEKALAWEETKHTRDASGRFSKQGGTKAAKQEPKMQDGMVLYHGTRLHNVEDIKAEGFTPNGNEEDFGNAVYFKSPDLDHIDHKDFADWRDGRLAAGKSVPKAYLDRRGEDTTSIVNDFAGYNDSQKKAGNSEYRGAVIEATIPKEHVLDCTGGRPKGLQTLIDDFKKPANKTTVGRIQLAFKHLLGESLDGMNDVQIQEHFQKRRSDLQAAWGGERLMVSSMSPYEVFAKSHGVGAIIDKLDNFSDEGWQIGVYDPKLIRITQHGKHLAFEEGKAKLIKALVKAYAENNNAYCLVHHEMTDAGLVLHIGVHQPTDNIEKSLGDFRSLMAEWEGEPV